MSSHFPKSKSQNLSNGLKPFPRLTQSLLLSLFTIPQAHRQVRTTKVFCTCYFFWSSLLFDICRLFFHFLQFCNHPHSLKFYHANNPYVFSLLNFLIVEVINSNHHHAVMFYIHLFYLL